MRLFLAFLAVPLIEIALFIQVGGLIGLWPTLAIVILTAIAGTYLVKQQGARAMNDLRSSFSDLRDPSEPLAHGAMILVSGVLLLTPGFFTDALGFALLVPGFRSAVMRYLRKTMNVQTFQMGQMGPDPRQSAHPRHPHSGPSHPARPAQGEVIDGEFTEVPPGKSPNHPGSGWTRH